MFNCTRLTFAGLRTISAAPTKPPPRLAHANHSAKVDVAPTKDKAAAKPKVLCLLNRNEYDMHAGGSAVRCAGTRPARPDHDTRHGRCAM